MLNYRVGREFFRYRDSDKLIGLSNPQKEAYLFRTYLETIPIHLHPDEPILGWYGYPDAYPEDIQAYIKSPAAQHVPLPGDHPEAIFWSQYITCSSHYYLGHHTIDFSRLLSMGLDPILEEVKQELSVTPLGSEKHDYLMGMQEALEATPILGCRFAELAEEEVLKTENPAKKAHLKRMADICRKVPMKPAEDLLEAIQAAYLLWSFVCISDSDWCSVGFGSLDQILYPYYLRSKEAGMSDEEVISLFCHLFRLLDVYGGMDAVVCLGGVDADGNDLVNQLSRLIVEAEKRTRLRAPLLAARIHKNTSQEFLLSLIDPLLFEIGQPSFYSEETCTRSMCKRGLEPETAARWQVNSCMGMVIPGEEISDMWGCIFNMHLPLELTLNHGRPLHGELPITLSTLPRDDYRSIDDIFEQYALYLKELLAFFCKVELKELYKGAYEKPNPWVSALTKNCISKGLDMRRGGAVYTSVTIEAMTFGNTADAITAIDQLVFHEHRYTIPQLLEAARHNFDDEVLHAAVMQCPKYGQNDIKADNNTRRIMDILADICEEACFDNVQYLPSLHTLNNDVTLGEHLYATLDGRRAGEPFCKNAGPANDTRTAGPTSVAMSALQLNQDRISGGGALDIHVGGTLINTPEKREKFAAFIRTYLSMGGLQLQVNGISSNTLQAAYDDPKAYPNLIIRIGGHSRYYHEMSDSIKRDFIVRTRIEEACS